MKHIYSKLQITLLLILFFIVSLSAQKSNVVWSKISKENIAQAEKVIRKSEPKKATFYQLDLNKLKIQLENAPLRGASNKVSNLIVDFPNADGTIESYRVKEAPVMVPEMQANHPEIRSYVGQSIDNPSTLIRFSVTPLGLHTMTLSAKKGAQYIDPFTTNLKNYVVYTKRDLPKLNDDFVCGFEDNSDYSERTTNNSTYSKNANDGMMRTFRLALACTAEYGNIHGSSVPTIKSAMTVTMTRVNGIYERDLSLTMTMVENSSIIYFGDVDMDPYTNDNESTMLGENQTEITAKIGSGNYDIGHVFGTGGGGVAATPSVCNNSSKARGVTGSPSPTGDAFDIDYVCHEMGHQFGAPHTFNGDAAGTTCVGQRSSTNAYEPGSGSTIMAYAGICSPQNVQLNSDAYFHQKSLQVIWDNITTGSSTCATLDPTGNTVPTAEAGSSYSIPILTPYKLTGSSTDAVADGTSSHTFTWEQYDLGPAGVPTETTDPGPLVRSFEGTDNTTRYIPRLADLRFSNGSSTWEKLSSVNNRDINFQLTVRDNDSRGGQTATDNMVVTTVDANGAFLVTSQATSGIAYSKLSSQTVTWDVANTDMAPFNVSNVNIWLSTDGGMTYDTNLAMNTPNDGSHVIIIPDVEKAYCRVMVEAVGNIFFNINSENFSVGVTVVNTCIQYDDPGSLAIPIPDGVGSNMQGTTLDDIISVPDSGIITSVKVNVEVTHDYVQDLVIQLDYPNGNPHSSLWSRDCLAQDGLDITFDDGGIIQDCGTTPPPPLIISGTYIPASPLSVFNDLEVNGDWKILIADFYNGDTGVFNNWSLDICFDTEVPLSTEDFGLSNFSIFPNPNNGEFTVKLNSTSNNNIEISVYDMRGRSLFNNSYKNTSAINQTINLNHVQSGMYLVKVSDGTRSATKKIIIK